MAGQEGIDPELERTGVRPGAVGETADPDAEGETVLVDRDGEGETIVVDRGAGTAADRTIVVDRAAPGEEAAAVTRERRGTRRAPAGRRRRGLAPPPVEPGFGRGVVAAPGPGAVLPHPRRDVPPPPAPPAALETWNVATRVPDPGMPSVARRSRRAGVVALVAVAGSVVVSLAGLVALGFAVLGG